jgi:hypothetical protein
MTTQPSPLDLLRREMKSSLKLHGRVRKLLTIRMNQIAKALNDPRTEEKRIPGLIAELTSILKVSGNANASVSRLVLDPKAPPASEPSTTSADILAEMVSGKIGKHSRSKSLRSLAMSEGT